MKNILKLKTEVNKKYPINQELLIQIFEYEKKKNEKGGKKTMLYLS